MTDQTSPTAAEPGIAADCLQLCSFLTPLSAAAEFGRYGEVMVF